MTRTHEYDCPTAGCRNTFHISLHSQGEDQEDAICPDCGKTVEWHFKDGQLSDKFSR